ncbi:unnamed protein product [Dracunculus medinensis]|uniref:TPR_REGION domain-containing protein n=1 Tax=Dracunculus medinensis TaxID=318479 RepID=A0A0N4UND9_DRAME|nr:unnamed protein product [Dracunculus medinensis]
MMGRKGREFEIDERMLLHIYGPEIIDTTAFHHFLIKKQTLVSIHEATKHKSISQGRPSLFMVIRTPHQCAVSVLAHLYSRPNKSQPESAQKTDMINIKINSIKQTEESKSPKIFKIPHEFNRPLCKLDTIIPPIQPTTETDRIIKELNDIRKNMSHGESFSRASDARNVWLKEPLASELSKPVQPHLPPDDCNAGRVLLYDLGFISQEAYDNGDFVMLNSTESNEFYRVLHEMVDRSPTKLLQTAFVFYVKEGQRNALDILENAMTLENTNEQFCALLAMLGDGVDVKSHAHWTGNWATAFSSDRRPTDQQKLQDHYILDGHAHCLWWSDAHIEIATLMPSKRCFHQSNDEYLDRIITIPEEYKSTVQYSRKMQRAKTMTNSDGEKLNNAVNQQNCFNTDETKSKRAMSLSTEVPGRRNSFIKRNVDQRIFIVWLENYEDIRHFPTDEMFAYTYDGSLSLINNSSCRPDYVAIFLYQIESGLVRVRISGDWTKCGLPGPLFDDCVVSNGTLPALLRWTIISITRRKTVELENYQMVYARRRHAIQEFARKYSIAQSYAELLERLIL